MTTRVCMFIAFALFTFIAAPTTTCWGQSAKTTLTDPVLAERFNAISDRLVCQCGCHMILRVCNHVNCPSGIPMRESIERQLLAGAPDDSIVAGFVGEYGLKVLSSPPTTGLNLAAWVMPGFALFVGLFVIGYFASRWAASRRLASAQADASTIDPELRARIEDELRRP